MKKYLNPAICVWAFAALALLIFVSQPRGDFKENITDSYAAFLPGQRISSFTKSTHCDPVDYVATYYTTILFCPVSDESTYVRGIYVVVADGEIRSAYFYLKPNTVVVGDLIIWFDRWDKESRTRRRVYGLTWSNMSASLRVGWPGLDTEIASISFNK